MDHHELNSSFTSQAPKRGSTSGREPRAGTTFPWGSSRAGTVNWIPARATTDRRRKVSTHDDRRRRYAGRIEACTDRENPTWVAVGSTRIEKGTGTVVDPSWQTHARRFYRCTWPR